MSAWHVHSLNGPFITHDKAGYRLGIWDGSEHSTNLNGGRHSPGLRGPRGNSLSRGPWEDRMVAPGLGEVSG